MSHLFRRYRELGNQAFKKGMDWKALELYNESVCQAPQDENNDKERMSSVPDSGEKPKANRLM